MNISFSSYQQAIISQVKWI